MRQDSPSEFNFVKAALAVALISPAINFFPGYAYGACPSDSSSGVNVASGGTCTAALATYQTGSVYLLRAYGIGSILDVTAPAVQLTQDGSQEGHGAVFTERGGVINVQGALDIFSNATGSYNSGVSAHHDGSIVNLGSNTTIVHHGNSVGGGGITAEIGKVSITANGPLSVITDGAMALYGTTGSSIVLKDINLKVGDNGNPNNNGILVTEAGSLVSYANGIINTSGTAIRVLSGAAVTASGASELTTSLNQAHGISVDGPTSSGTFNSSTSITTSGTEAYGLNASNQGTIRLLGGGDIKTAGVNAYGALADHGTIDIVSSILTTAGHNSNAINAFNSGIINVTGSSIITNGKGSTGIKVLDESFLGSTVNLFDTQVRTEGPDAWAADVKGTLNMQGGTLSSAFYGAMLASGDATINLENSAQVIGGNGTLLSVANENSLVNLTLANNVYAQGDINFANSSNVDALLSSRTKVSLLNSSSWTGSTNAIDSLWLDPTSKWMVTDDSKLNRLDNSGSVYVGGSLGTTVTVSDTYTSNGGLLSLKTQLGDDASPTDKLVAGKVVLGVAATRLSVNNINGLGALTTGNGIEVVHVNDSSASAAGAFALGNRVAAGAYEYTLQQNGLSGTNGNWYLRSTMPVIIPPVVVPPPATRPNYRAEVPLNMALPALTNRFALAMLGTYHDRRAVSSASGKESTVKPTTWGRVLAEKGSAGKNGYSAFMDQGSSYDYDIKGFQVGQDLYGAKNPNGTTDIAGIYVGRGDISGTVGAVAGGRAGSASMDGTSLGAYWTRKGESGWYVDSVLQGTVYSDVKTHSGQGEKLKTKGRGMTASVEGGYPIALGNNWAVEPQAQLIYQQISLDRDQDTFGKFKFDDTKTGYARVGSRLTKQFNINSDQPATVWARANVWQQIGPDSRTTVTDVQGTNAVSLATSLGGTWAQVGVGVTGKITESVSAFAGTDYNQTMGSGDGHSISGRVGLEVIW